LAGMKKKVGESIETYN